MNRKLLIAVLVGTSATAALDAAAESEAGGLYLTAVTYPIKQLGTALRALSLSGSTGNVLSIALYAVICLLPVVWLVLSIRKRGFAAEDILKPVLSALLFPALYFAVNPTLLPEALGGAATPQTGLVLLGSVCWGAVICYAVIRALRLSLDAGREKLERALTLAMYFLAAFFTFAAVYNAALGIGEGLRSLAEGNTGYPGKELTLTRVFIAARELVKALPAALDVPVALRAAELMRELRDNRDTDRPVAAAEKLSRTAAAALIASLAARTALDILQLICAKRLAVIDAGTSLPLAPVLFVLTVLLIAQLLRERKSYRDENESFI